MRKKARKILVRASIAAGIFLVFDLVIHTLFSRPQETFLYFLFLSLIAFLVAGVLFWLAQKPVWWQVGIATVIAVIVKAGYYRLTEWFGGYAYLSRVPVIFWVDVQAQFWLSVMLWALVHGAGFVLGVLVAGKIGKQ